MKANDVTTHDRTGGHFKDDTVTVGLSLSSWPPNLVTRLTNAFQTPKAVPNSASFPTRIGIDAMKAIALVLRAKELNRIGASGCTVVRPIRAKTTT
jgi:hypothetical protein